MTILVTGGTGQVGSIVLQNLAAHHVPVRALTRDPAKAAFPVGVTPVTGDMLDVQSMRIALDGVSTLFLLNAVSPQELTQALLTLSLAREAGIRRVVYFSVFNGEEFSDVPHFASKHAVERMIEQTGIPATILRPNCFMQNDAQFFRNALMGPGIYPFPIGEKGVSMVRTAESCAVGAVFPGEQQDAELVHPLLVNLCYSESCADTPNAILRYVQALSTTPVTQEDILIISKGMKDMIFHEWTEKLIARKADRLPMGPLDDHPAFIALKDATAFSSLAKEYRSCLDTHVCRAAMGRAAFYTVTHRPYLIVEVVRYHHSNREIWALKGIHNRANRRVSSRDKHDIEGLLRLRGITELRASNDPRLSPELVSVLSSGTTYGDGLY